MYHMTDTSKEDFLNAGHADNLLAYTGGSLTNEQGHKCLILDTKNIDFSTAPSGRKKVVTMVAEAQGGENTAQIFKNAKETQCPYTAEKGDAIFVQGDITACLKYMATGELDDEHGSIDVYVPDNAELSETGRLQFKDLEAEGYEIQSPNRKNPGTFVKSPSALILPEANSDWVCIAYESDQVKFFPPRSSFKLLEGKVSGINPEAFAETWEIATKSNKVWATTPIKNEPDASL